MTEPPEYHRGWDAARSDIEAGRSREWVAGMEAPTGWLRGYDARMALAARTEARHG